MRFLANWFVKLTGWIPQLLVFRIKVHYEDKKIQGKRIKGKAIIISNHNALMDFAVMMFVFWRRTLSCAVAEVVYQKNFLLPPFLGALGCVRVDRGAHDFSFLTKLESVLDKGGVVEIYPESRIPDRDEERPVEFKPSYIPLALESGAPIIPVYNNGNAFSRKRAEVVIGKPIYVAELYDPSLSEKENISNINQYVRSKVIELGKKLEGKEEKETAVL
ncbi:MAG: 1-acyl-sn-glycerol-3-phosphate acyltransferase [Clostridia bacterium]|nr:1-acyl-sn-glycerol-3-phosphate acyltransferase [Clostridia bacterium]